MNDHPSRLFPAAHFRELNRCREALAELRTHVGTVIPIHKALESQGFAPAVISKVLSADEVTS